MKKAEIFRKLKALFNAIGGFICLTSLLLSISTVMFVVSCKSQKELHEYKMYYVAAEELLDSLESQFNWLDSYDPGITYDNYIKARKKLK